VSALLVFCTCPDDDTAERIAQALVERRLAACVSRGPVRSVYRWRGAVESAAEVQLVIKTTRGGYDALERAIRELHPYELPEILAVEAAAGLAGYLDWIGESVTDPPMP
jgi:periplasmic divalent cation tolerance protein